MTSKRSLHGVHLYRTIVRQVCCILDICVPYLLNKDKDYLEKIIRMFCDNEHVLIDNNMSWSKIVASQCGFDIADSISLKIKRGEYYYAEGINRSNTMYILWKNRALNNLSKNHIVYKNRSKFMSGSNKRTRESSEACTSKIPKKNDGPLVQIGPYQIAPLGHLYLNSNEQPSPMKKEVNDIDEDYDKFLSELQEVIIERPVITTGIPRSKSNLEVKSKMIIVDLKNSHSI
ncbi:hypothetical protein TetV_454 [Tetraselmis virus 1]|uniref:Uncharacterized protein n=1 Tax=Tetraselmis virus 1 TaxID=2060617 RepID=A0A2P0VNP8_9VIRU|nr:hypothetical protein QJ968_gp600 [Tetraselmis virus 1]AUF82536.1 hypothetical protein TetV_454 [Tetraselmis virus 1]